MYSIILLMKNPDLQSFNVAVLYEQNDEIKQMKNNTSEWNGIDTRVSVATNAYRSLNN